MNNIINYLTLTQEAKQQIVSLIEERKKTESSVMGIRIGLKPKGCSGMKYAIEYAESVNVSPYDDVFIEDDIKVFIDPKISMLIIGMQMDYTSTKTESGFIFKNPNEKGRCGCGESFYA